MATDLRNARMRALPAALLVLGLGTLPPTRAHAQEPDSLTTWLDWGSLAFLIKADTIHGVQVWANALVARKNGAEPRTVVGRYDPGAIATWVPDAELLLLPDRAGPSDPPRVLAVTPLTDLRNGRLIVARRREGDRWSSKVVFSFNPAADEPLTFSVERSQATELFAALGRAAAQSRLRDRSATLLLNSCGVTDTVSYNAVRLASPVARYPATLRDRGIPGLTVVRFVVDVTGTPLMDDGYAVVFSSDPAFTQATRDMVAASRYQPAMRDGRPARSAVCQPVLYMITSRPRYRP